MNTSKDFILEYTTTQNGTKIRLPFADRGRYNCIVDWGDGSQSEVKQRKLKQYEFGDYNLGDYNRDTQYHAYKKNDTYRIQIRGKVEELCFQDLSTNLTYLTVRQWGAASFGDFAASVFDRVKNVTLSSADGPDLSEVEILDFCFSESQVVIERGIENWGVSNIRSFRFMFANYKDPLPSLEKWKVRDDADLEGMFDNCHGETPIPSWYKRWQAKQKAELSR